jgi:hypothetical protein
LEKEMSDLQHDSLYPLLVELGKLIGKHFALDEMAELSNALGIEFENITGQTRAAKGRELTLYCQRRLGLAELIIQIEIERPKVKLPLELLELRGPGLQMDEWLRKLGLTSNPFHETAYKAEEDTLLGFGQARGVTSAFVEPSDFEQICGRLDAPGYPFVFAAAGGGKTALALAVQKRLDEEGETATLTGLPGVLTVFCSLMPELSLTQQIVHAFEKRLGRRLDILLTDTPQQLFTRLAEQARQVAEVQEICILIDGGRLANDDPDSCYRILHPLLSEPGLLNVDGVFFQFYLPVEMLGQLSSDGLLTGPIYVAKWDLSQLEAALEKRLVACLGPGGNMLSTGERYPATAMALGLICDQALRNDMAQQIVEVGLKGGQPRNMWRLGNALLREHFQTTPDGLRPLAHLIGRPTLYRALAYFTESEYRSLNRPERGHDGDNLATASELVEAIRSLTEAIHALRRRLTD